MAKADKIKIPEYISELHLKFKNELDEINNTILSNLECDEDLIYDAAKYLISSGGKRIRPLLTIISANLFGYKDGNAHINLAAATEFIHVATLLHDDVVDSSLLRRFKPTVNSVWGNKEAILVGDFLFSKSFKLMVSAKSLAALECLATASSKIAMGEVKQLTKLKSDMIMTEEEYFEIISSKTAELFAASCKVGGIIAEASEQNIEKIYQVGRNIGLIFQIKDDMLDYFSTAEKIGKNIGDDFFESKVTLPVIYLNQFSDKQDKDFVKYIFIDANKERQENEFKKFLSLLEKYKISEKINSKLSELKTNTEKIIESLEDSDELMKKYLNKILLFASEREN